MIRTRCCRIKDKHRPWLNTQAREVNFVWNYANELSHKVLKREGRFLSPFELQKYTDGASKECSLHAHTSQEVGRAYECAGVWFEEVNEAYSTQTCSCCGSRTGPKGVAGLGIRGWQCSACETVHDRDINAAKNILAAGRGRLAEGILVR